MWESRSRSQWDQTANVVAAIGSVLGGKVRPADVNPWTTIDAKRGINRTPPLSEERTADLLIATLAPKDFKQHMAEKRRRRREAKANGEPKRD